MKAIGNPVEVDFYTILAAKQSDHDGSWELTCSEGKTFVATKEMVSREAPEIGGYYVIQADGYAYLNPKHVFERKYRAV